MRKCAYISPYMRRPLVIYSMTLQLLHSEFPYLWGKFYFLFISVLAQFSMVYGAKRVKDLTSRVFQVPTWRLPFQLSLRRGRRKTDFYCDGRAVPPTMNVPYRRPGKELLSCELLAIPAAQQPKSHLCVPFLGIAGPQSQCPHSCACERFIYSQDQSTYIFPEAEKADQSWEYT